MLKENPYFIILAETPIKKNKSVVDGKVNENIFVFISTFNRGACVSSILGPALRWQWISTIRSSAASTGNQVHCESKLKSGPGI